MKTIVYDISMAAGVLLIGAGVGMVSVPAALVTVGALVILLTLLGAFLGSR